VIISLSLVAFALPALAGPLAYCLEDAEGSRVVAAASHCESMADAAATAKPAATHLPAIDESVNAASGSAGWVPVVDTSKGRYTATLLSGGKTTAVPISASKSGILTGRPVPKGDWVLLFRVEAPSRAPVQVRYSSGMARSGQKSSDKKRQEGHAHDHH
jgi:hypothetical protein